MLKLGFLLREIKVLHLEPTDVCQAACPMCLRETDLEFNKDQQNHLTLDQISKHYTDNAISKLEKMFMCGIYGDPAAGRHTLEIYKYFRKINPDITLGMNTNGAIQTTSWWHKLANILNKPRDYVVFSIDGLEDTNHLYRVNVQWERLVKNAQAFIEAGGNAHWDMLVYKHNQHQVDTCEKIAKDMGFKWFRAKVSRRGFTETLQFPEGWEPVTLAPGPIKCHALTESSEYIDAQGRLAPCCWIGGRQSNFESDFNQIQNSWSTSNPNATCKSVCSTTNNQSTFLNQWQREVNLEV
jgi:sulfatase maturation enzyme AslB (radical SAM superfamily)